MYGLICTQNRNFCVQCTEILYWFIIICMITLTAHFGNGFSITCQLPITQTKSRAMYLKLLQYVYFNKLWYIYLYTIFSAQFSESLSSFLYVWIISSYLSLFTLIFSGLFQIYLLISIGDELFSPFFKFNIFFNWCLSFILEKMIKQCDFQYLNSSHILFENVTYLNLIKFFFKHFSMTMFKCFIMCW